MVARDRLGLSLTVECSSAYLTRILYMAALPLIFIICVAFTGFTEGNGVLPPVETVKAEHTTVDINEPVSNITITTSSTDLVEFNSSVTLSCSSSGSSISFLWLNGSSEITASERVQLTDGGSNLTIINVTRFDQGPLRCRVSSPVSNGTSDPVKLSVYYGPENINLIVYPLQEYYDVGSDIIFRCKADSRPPAKYLWLVNGTLFYTDAIGISLIDARTSQSGNYSCQAFNSKTLRYQTSQPSAIIILAQSSECGVICIDGIIIACCVLVAGVAAVGSGYYIYKKKRRSNQSTHRDNATTTGSEGQDNPASSSQELNFANVRFFPNKNGGSSSYYASPPPSYDDVMQEVNRSR